MLWNGMLNNIAFLHLKHSKQKIMQRLLSTIMQKKSFIKFEEPILFLGFNAIGYFPYEVAQMKYKECVAVPRSVFSEIEKLLSRTHYMDNKIVVVFEDTTRFGSQNFAIQFKDGFCKMGSLDQIMGYAATELL
jgi:hypothetical protein